MPAPSIKSLAAKAGKSEAEAEKLWSKAKEEAKGSKLKDGSTVPSKESAFKDKDWAYTTGIFKKMLGESLNEDGIIGITGYGSSELTPGYKWPGRKRPRSESDARYRVFLNGDEVQMICNGRQVALGEDGNVERVREKIQDLLDRDIESVFDLGGVVGTLAEIEQQVFRDWVLFCTGDKPMTIFATDGGS